MRFGHNGYAVAGGVFPLIAYVAVHISVLKRQGLSPAVSYLPVGLGPSNARPFFCKTGNRAASLYQEKAIRF